LFVTKQSARWNREVYLSNKTNHFQHTNSSTTHLQTLVVRLIYADKVWGLEILPHSKIPQWFIQVEGILSERKIIKTI